MHAHSECFTTLKKSAVFSGPTVFLGKNVSVKITSDPQLDGIYLKRVDLPLSTPFKACIESVLDTPRTTIIGTPECHVMLVEHLLATLFSYGITRALIEIDGPEVPIGDGSALHIVKAIEEAEVENETTDFPLQLSKPITFEFKDQLILGLPSSHFKISYMLQYPGHPLLDAQFYSFEFSKEAFKKEIAPCRTFSLKHELDQMIERGLLKGVSLDYGLAIDQETVLNPEGLRFRNEMVRHKILDILGDFALAEVRPALHIVAIKSGHFANTHFAKLLKSQIKAENHYGR